ncbi:hypothetical protein ElyMa_000790500 [Elysia marginata]|uniref:H15 domain-containing protein n=1 Tax=Elysia marginata TaxID=1093978 RepID=A0AAV4GVH9_9GAST|nr:hypothetical protein ElyMa_000790500 [Elysia marginata]
MDQDSNANDNFNSHPFHENQAGPSTSVTEAYPGTKALVRPKKSSRMMTKLVNAIRVLGKDKGAPLGGIRNYLISNDLVSPKTADCKILSTVSDALKKGIVTLGTASDFNWLFRLAGAAAKRAYSPRRNKKKGKRSTAKKRKSSKRKTRKTKRRRRNVRKSTRKGTKKKKQKDCGRFYWGLSSKK